MAGATFTCDRCGNEFPQEQLKEVFREQDGERVKMQVDASCLDEILEEAGRVTGTEGDEKRRAAEIVEEGPGPAERESMPGDPTQDRGANG